LGNSFLSTPSLGITVIDAAGGVVEFVPDFQLPLSGSHHSAATTAFTCRPSSRLSTPSLGITHVLRLQSNLEALGDFQLPLSGSLRGLLRQIRCLCNSANFQLPLSGSRTFLERKTRTFRPFQLPLSGSPQTEDLPRVIEFSAPQLSTPSLGITRIRD